MIYLYEDISDVNLNLKNPHSFKECVGIGISGYECLHCGLIIDYVKCDISIYYHSIVVRDKNFKAIKASECNKVLKEDINNMIEV